MMACDGLWWIMMAYDGLWWIMMVYDGLGENKVLENYVCPQVFLNPKSFFIPQTFFFLLYVFPMHSIGLRREWVGVYNSVWGLRFCCLASEPQIKSYAPNFIIILIPFRIHSIYLPQDWIEVYSFQWKRLPKRFPKRLPKRFPKRLPQPAPASPSQPSQSQPPPTNLNLILKPRIL